MPVIAVMVLIPVAVFVALLLGMPFYARSYRKPFFFDNMPKGEDSTFFQDRHYF